MYQPTSRNILVNSPNYGSILAEYNRRFKESQGKVNEKKFWSEIIVPLLPNYGLMNWYQFLRRWRNAAGLEAVARIPLLPQGEPNEEQKILLSNEIATQTGINAALNIGNKALMDLVNDPRAMAKLSPKDRADLLFKAMKSQDSRIHAIGKIKQDNRDEARFNRAFAQDGYRNE